MSSPPPTNSLLNLLNPYASVASSRPHDRPPDMNSSADSTQLNDGQPEAPESPSAILLRELQFDLGGASPTKQSRVPSASGTSTTKAVAQAMTDSSEDEEPPQSVMFDNGGVDTPKSRSPPGAAGLSVPSRPWSGKAAKHSQSPGPFRRRPSSTSTSPARSRQSSPGPSRDVFGSITSRPATESIHSPTTTSSTDDEVLAVRQPTPPRRQSGPQAAQPAVTLHPHFSPDDLNDDSPPTPGPSKPRTKGRGKHKYYQVAPEEPETGRGRSRGTPSLRKSGLSGRDKALWKWVNVVDLDGFLQEVYGYYKGKGIWCIALARVLNLMTTLFVIGFSTFLLSCIDYSKLASSVAGPNAVGKLDDALVPQCLTRGSFGHMLFIVSVAVFYIFQLTIFAMSIPRLVDLWRFYTYLLGIPDADIQTLPWPEIVRLIGHIKKHNPVTSLSNGQGGALADMVGDDATRATSIKLDAHDIANRILRQENYLIALFNKDLLDLRVRIPLPKRVLPLVPPALLAGPSQGGLPKTNADEDPQYLTFGGNTLTTALEWNLRYCLMGYLFDARGQVKKEVVMDRGRKDLVEALRKRILFMGIVNCIFAPFIVVYLLIYSFFRYFEEYHKNPSSLGSRQYTPYAQWKFREFNELPHLFERRLDMSYPVAKEYIDQFPKERTALVMRFVAFIAGSFAAVLLVASLFDPDLFLHFEVTPHRTVLFYIGLFGSILAIARGMIPEENLVFDPEFLMREVVRFTHYLPAEWVGKLHSQQVHTEFGTLFQLKVSVFVQELVSVIFTPFILWYSLAPCSGAIIDFFREFTVHVEGVGYVCSFAVFDFQRYGNVGPAGAAAAAAVPTDQPAQTAQMRRRAVNRPANTNYLAGENKMEKSFLHFKATHPDWQPSDPNSSVLLDRLVGQQGGRPATHLAGSMYAGGRGLGLGHQLASSSTSPILPRSALHTSGMDDSRRWFAPGSTTRADSHLAPMAEGDDEDEEDEAEAMGWNKRVEADDEDEAQGERGLIRDAGIILQQVMNR